MMNMMPREAYLTDETRTPGELATDAQSSIEGGIGDLLAGYHLDALNSLRSAARDLEALEVAAVRHARLDGWSWDAIADYFGVSRQAAHERFAQYCK